MDISALSFSLRSIGCVKSWSFLAGFSPFGDSMTSISHPGSGLSHVLLTPAA